MQEQLSRRHLVLLGIGHTNAHIVRMWGMHPLPDTDLTCISDFGVATYSGMLPAVLAGQKTRRQMQIDLVQLCRSVNARLLVAEVTGLDPERGEVLFRDRPPVPFDVLSVGIGSVPTMADVQVDSDSLVTIKPMQTFQDRLAATVARLPAVNRNAPLRLTIVGSGVAGVEISFCLPRFLATLTDRPLQLQMVTRSDQVAPELNQSARQRIVAEMQRRSIDVIRGRAVTVVQPGQLVLDDETQLPADLVIWATGAAAPPTLQRLGLPVDQRGFLQTDQALRCPAARPIFAVGDTGTIVGDDVPKAGVYAVRQGPVLWDNIQRVLDGRSLQQYQPQRSFLKLLNRGDGTAIGQWRGLSFSGRWVWKLKDWIDSRFMQKYQPQTAMNSGEPMQCRGCGCKLGSQTLEAALAGAGNGQNSIIPRDDAADIGPGSRGGRLMASTDFFSSPVDDAFLFGRVAALHAASDLIASGATVSGALANVVLPEGDGTAQQRLLQDFLAGATTEFSAMGASVVGGHTIVGPRLEAGFTVFGQTQAARPCRKDALQPGNVLLLTKPLGIGILVAAWHRSQCSAADFEQLLQGMLQRQHTVISVLAEHTITGVTDITGFGLAGHLLEMLKASDVSAQIRLQDIPVLPGVRELSAGGIASSLAPDNRRCESDLSASSQVRADDRYPVLFDPQTCGGLLLAVAADRSDSVIAASIAAGLHQTVRIGQVHERQADESWLHIV